MSRGYSILATRSILGDPPPKETSRLRRGVMSLGGGLVGAALGGAHPVLGALIGSSIVKSAIGLSSGEQTVGEAARSIGASAVAAGCSAALPVAPLVGYGVGVVVGNAVFGAKAAPALDSVRSGLAVIKRGMKGDAVVYVQAIVGAVANGDFGAGTEKAVKAFQKSNGIKADGVIGRDTLAAIDRLAGGSQSVGPAPVTQAWQWGEPGSVKQVPSSPQPTRTAPAVATSTPDIDPATLEAARRAVASSQVQSPATSAPATYTPSPSALQVNQLAVIDAPPGLPADANNKGFLSALKAPLWDGSSVTLGHGLAVLGAAVVAVGAGAYFLSGSSSQVAPTTA